MSELADRADVPARLKLYDELRVRRTSITQLLSRTSEVHDESVKTVRRADVAFPEEVSALFRQYSAGPTPGMCFAVPVLLESSRH